MSAGASFLGGFSKAFENALDNNPQYQARIRAEAQIAFDNSPVGIQLAAHNLQKQAAVESARFGRERGRAIDGAVSYFSNPEEQEAIRNTLDGFDLASVNRFVKDTIDNKDFTGLVHLNPDEIDSKTYKPIAQGSLKQVGTTNFWYHSAKSLQGKHASATNKFTRRNHILGREYMKEKEVKTLSNEEKTNIYEKAFQSLTTDEQTLFTRQSRNFNAALENTINKYSGSGNLIVTNKAFRKQLLPYQLDLERARVLGDEFLINKAKNRINAIQLNHKQLQQTGYGYGEDQYRSELRSILSRSVGALGLSDAEQIENFMTQFLEDEKNKARLLNKMMLKYGAPKTDTSVAGGTRGSDARTKKTSEAKVTNTHLGK